MKKLSNQYINNLITRLEQVAINNVNKDSFDRAIRKLKALSFIRYKFYLGYKDDFIESQIRELAKHIVKAPFVVNDTDKTIAIIDEINSDYIGLMTQYIAPFIQDSYQILYLYEHVEHQEAVREHLMRTLGGYEKAQMKEIPTDKGLFAKAQWIYDEVNAFSSTNVLMNFGEWAVEKCIACYALPAECTKYHINAGDHCFWAGASCVDYSFEFRHYGANLTHYARGLKREQVVYLPFYPVMKEVEYKGLPDECRGKFIFLSGGAAYKVVDEDKTYFRLCKEILDQCPEAVVLYAGANANNIDNSVLKDGVEQSGLHGRFISIGYRNDLLEVFRHCDVYLDTYPLGGGLMCQFAAHCSKPILKYKNPDEEECVAQKNDCHFSYDTESTFIEEAVKLYFDSAYRQTRGKEMHNGVVSKEEFDTALLAFMDTGKKTFEIKWDNRFVPRLFSTEDAINYNNKALFVFYYKLFQLLGMNAVCMMPGSVISFGLEGIRRKISKIFRK